jgi:hemerythrin-like domain-containing protein
MAPRTPRRPPTGLIIAGIATGLVALGAFTARRRTKRGEDAARADVGFMRAMHAALRRDMDRLETVAPQLDRTANVPPPVEDRWTEFREELERHHEAEDDDLWPVLRSHLGAAEDHDAVDQMVVEHRALQPAIDAVDAALSTGRDVIVAVEALGTTLRSHLDHEERVILPLLERHLSRHEWRAFLLTERRRTPLRHRPEFLGWVLDEANDEDTHAVMAELPPPGRLVYRKVLRPRYAAKHRWEANGRAMSRAS